MKRTNRNTSTQKPLTPNFAAQPTTEVELLRQQVSLLEAQNAAQRHALRELNKAARFAVKHLGQPFYVRPLDRPAKKGRGV
jgi:hypothetical protein